MNGILIFMAIVAVIGIGFALYNPKGLVSLMFMLASPLFAFYLLVYLIVSLSNEKNSFSLWMQTPLPGWSLFAAKLTAGMIYMLLSGLVALILTLIVFQLDGSVSIMIMGSEHELTPDLMTGDALLQFVQDHYVSLALSTLPMTLGVAMLLAAGYLLFFILNKVLQRWLGKWSILASFMLVIAVSHLYDRLDAWGLKQLFAWGHIPLPVPSQFMAGEHHIGIGVHHLYEESLSLGHFVFDLLVLGVVVLLSGWLLDRKAEVR